MKKLFYLLILLLPLCTVHAQIKLSDEARISILTSYPSDDAVFTVYGHTALRVVDPFRNYDIVFNYGIFDFSKPNFIYRFAKGETDYILDTTTFDRYLPGYEMRGSRVVEQVLNLYPVEMNSIWEKLVWNMLPENRVYRYNFFYDNCSTRPVVLVESNVIGEVKYNHPEEPKTFREMINDCTRNDPWQTFGCDLALGSADKVATQHEEMFLPLYLMDAFAEATIVNPDGTERPLVIETNILFGGIENDEVESIFFTPLMCGWLLFILVAGITGLEWYRRKYFRVVDFLIFLTAGIAGCILFFLSFVSEHPATWPNWLILWLHPFHLIGAVLFVVKKWAKAAYCYHFINFALLTLMLVGWHFIPQHLNAAFIPLVLVLWIRSVYGVYRHKAGIE